MNGKLLFGTTGGVYEVLKVEKENDNSFTPNMDIKTPLLWHGSLEQTKETSSLLIQAAGKGVITIDAQDENGKIIG